MGSGMMFLYGFVGAFVVDFEKIHRETAQDNHRSSRSSKLYRQPGFWIPQLIHSLGGGFLAVAWGQSFPQTMPLTLMGVGGAAGLIVERFGKLIANKF